VFFTVFGSVGFGVALAYGVVTLFLRMIGNRGAEAPATVSLKTADIPSSR
jgi:hypothetical protein